MNATTEDDGAAVEGGDDPRNVAQRIADGLADLVPESRSGEGVQVTGPVLRQRNSMLYRVEIPSLRQALAVKVLLTGTPPRPDAAGARRQFHALEQAAAAFGRTEGIGVPAPRAMIPNAGAYAMDWIDGEPLTGTLRDERDAAAIRKRFALAGRWLATLHQAGPVSSGPLDSARKLAYLHEEAPALGVHRTITRALGLLEAACAEVATEPLPTTWAHGDFKPDNLLWTGASLVGIDIHLAGQTVILADLSSFLAHAAMDECRARWSLPRFRAPAWRGAFVTGYFGDRAPPARALAWLELYSMLRIWIETRAQPTGRLRALARRRLFIATLNEMMGRWA